jgi:hypothetical protein
MASSLAKMVSQEATKGGVGGGFMDSRTCSIGPVTGPVSVMTPESKPHGRRYGLAKDVLGLAGLG